MTTGLDMSLEDLIKNNKKPTPSRGRGTSGVGPARRGSTRSVNRTQPYHNPKMKSPDSTWQHDLYTNHQLGGFPPAAPVDNMVSSIETGTKLYISNLDYGVSNEDIKELFSEVGDMKRFSVHYDRSGRSKGTAEVVFSRRNDALSAVKRYNNVQLDGKPMKIEIVGTNIVTPAPHAINALLGNPNSSKRGGFTGSFRSGGRFGSSQGGARGRGGHFRGGSGGRGRGRGRGDPVSSEDLDADLEKYHSEAMQIN
ncbi:putative RNA and export factor binding protein [Zostera marina]|uniref:Putative RNA and export factor binding protein n=1 Tax=Zostera marina TaxID=29655 RepID=A0A0K9Q1N8_ZOSMR|nr:putative RNA and export factor binding protein [Zostera marina]